MPANQKVFIDITREKYTVFCQEVRTKAWIPPFSDSGFLRGAGLFADLAFDEPNKTVSIRVRELPKGETHMSLFNKIEDVFQSIAV